MTNTIEKKVLMKDVLFNINSLIVFELLGVHTVADLHLMYVLNTIPDVGTVVGLDNKGAEVVFRHAEEHAVNRILETICSIEKSKNVEA